MTWHDVTAEAIRQRGSRPVFYQVLKYILLGPLLRLVFRPRIRFSRRRRSRSRRQDAGSWTENRFASRRAPPAPYLDRHEQSDTGVPTVSARLRAMAQETERIVATGAYRAPDGRLVEIAAAVRRAREGTRMYGPQPVPVEGPVSSASPGSTVFRNEPADVARAFAVALLDDGRFAGRFDRIVFAVLDRRDDSPTRAAFTEVFGA